MKKYEITHLPVKLLSEAAKKTTAELDGVIKSLGGTYPPPPPPNPKTVVTYQNGTILELDLNGIIVQQHFPDNNNIVKIEIGTNINEIGNFFIYDAFKSLQELIIPTTVLTINNDSFFRGLSIEQQQIFTFLGRSKNDVMSISNYPNWNVDNKDNTIFRCTDGDLIPT